MKIENQKRAEDKFLLGVNPTSNNENDFEVVFHNQFPFFSSKVYPISIQDLSEKEVPMSTYSAYINGEGDLEIFRIEMMGYDKNRELEDYIEHLKSLEEWYLDYLSWLDERELGKPGVAIKDFSTEMPGLKIIKDSEGYMLLGHQLVVTFENEDDMDAFLEQELEIPESKLDHGIINTFE
ncbi:hypothetical protein K4L44_10020 [Halosquirtibacter laminarini]|uniref:Uncharacterized protein n=1 Tax=Halosquirtibacter laminarini TaxID=3374600 RepID=A0AC61NQT5_9BACT|nr:hypothetical protein K4L44_10020 [Prolixibacteraceae bacterium]